MSADDPAERSDDQRRRPASESNAPDAATPAASKRSPATPEPGHGGGSAAGTGSRDLRGVRDLVQLEPDPASVLRTFALGREVLSIQPVPAAWSNRVYRLRTDRGEFAVKQLLNPWRDPRWMEWLDEAWRFELAALDAGVAMPEPVPNPATGHWLGQVDAYTQRRRRREPDAAALV
ncbi:MAG: hypothetical protein ACRDQD_30870, partial [Nocardioidaceae bacterium]